jgi:predicted  nucleic acid-binding Zn-ribbon protein
VFSGILASYKFVFVQIKANQLQKVATVQRKTSKTFLPFAALSQLTVAPFTKDAERAAVFCLAELDRDKGGGFFKKRAAEKLVSIAEVYYPFWVAPFGSMTLLLDGLNITSHSISYSVLPDLKVFKDKMNIRSETRQAYVTFLSNNLNYFQVSDSEETKVINGLITDADFLKEFTPYLNEAVMTEAPVVDSVLISPTNDEAAVLVMTQELENLQSQFVGEVKELNELIKLLNLKTQEFLEMLREEVKQTEEKFTKPIEEAKALLEDKTAQINREYTEKITETSTQFEQETLAAQKEIITLEKTKEQLTTEIEHCEAEIKTATINKDDVTEQKWKEKRNELKKEIPEITKQTRALTEKIREIEENKKRAIFQLKSENDAKIKEASKDLMTIETSRDAEISILKREMEIHEELTANIIKQMDQLAKMREATIAEFDKLGVQQKNVNPSLVHMPFYLIRYQSGQNRRYTFVAPSFVGSVGVGAKLRSAMGKMKISQLFQPRSKKIVSLLHKFAILLEEDVAFGSDINEACSKANLLEAENLKQSIAAGLSKLKEDGWLSEQERKSSSQIMV